MFSGHMGTKSVKRLGSPLFIELSKMSPFTGTTKKSSYFYLVYKNIQKVGELE